MKGVLEFGPTLQINPQLAVAHIIVSIICGLKGGPILCNDFRHSHLEVNLTYPRHLVCSPGHGLVGDE